MHVWFTFLACAASATMMAANALYSGSLASGIWGGLLFAGQSLILDAWVASLAWLLAQAAHNRQWPSTLLWSALFLVLGAHSTYTLACSKDAELRLASLGRSIITTGPSRPIATQGPGLSSPPVGAPRAPAQGSNQKSGPVVPTEPTPISAPEVGQPSLYTILQATLLTLVVGLGFGIGGYYQRSSSGPHGSTIGEGDIYPSSEGGLVHNAARRTGPLSSSSQASGNNQARANRPRPWAEPSSRPSSRSSSAQPRESAPAPPVSPSTSPSSTPRRGRLHLILFLATVLLALLFFSDMNHSLSFQMACGDGVLVRSPSRTWLYRTPVQDMCLIPTTATPPIHSAKQMHQDAQAHRFVVPP